MDILKNLVRKSLSYAGVELIRTTQNPRKTLLGMSQLQINTIIDVGANNGQFARAITETFPHAQILCFEPLPSTYDELKLWADRQNGRVTVFNLAIGERDGMVDMFYHEDHSPSSSVLASTEITERIYPLTKRQEQIPVTLTSLDKALDGAGISIKDDILVKLDVQGYEDRVIRGGQATLRKARACIVEVSLDHLYAGQADFKNIVSQLYDLGFAYKGNLDQIYDDDGHIIFLDAVFARKRVGS